MSPVPISLQIDRQVFGLWDAASLDTEILGGLWDSEVPSHTPFPYAAYSIVSDAARTWTSGSAPGTYTLLSNVLFQIQIYLKEDNINDPKLQVASMLNSVRQVYDDALFTFDAGFGTSLVCRYANEHVMREIDGIWSANVTYAVIRSEAFIKR